jgi:hypothetical protein
MMNKSILHPLSILTFFGIFLTQNASAQTYCASKSNAPWTEWIATVQIGTLTNASQKEGYGNFLSQTTDLAKGSNYTFNLTKGFSWAADPTNATQQGRVWIDYNQNGTFEDSEIIISFTRNTNTGTVTIPTTATTGSTRMRVSLKTIGLPTACETFDKGEVEDYTVNITGSTGTGQADLTFGNITAPTTARVNEVLNFSYRFKNLGTGTAFTPFGGYGYVNLLQNGVIKYTLSYVRPYDIPAGFDSLVVFNETVPYFYVPGDYTMQFIADPDNRITESNESNNVFNFPITILANTTDNNLLRVTAVTGPTTANPSSTLPLSITIKNDATVSSAPDSVFYARWIRQFFGGGSYPVNYALNRVAVPAIAAGATVTVNANFVLPATLKTTILNDFQNIEPYVMLKSKADRLFSVAPIPSSSFAANAFYYPIQPAAVTDLALTGTQGGTTWDSLNRFVTWSVTVQNNGATAAQNIAVNVHKTGVVNSSTTTFSGSAIDSVTQLTGTGQTFRQFSDSNTGREENGTMYFLWKIPQLAAGASLTANFRAKVVGFDGIRKLPLFITATKRLDLTFFTPMYAMRTKQMTQCPFSTTASFPM